MKYEVIKTTKSSPDNDYKSAGGGTAPVQAMVMDGSDHVPRTSV